MTNVTTGLSNTFKLELLKGNMSFFSDQMRVSLIKENSLKKTQVGVFLLKN